MGGVGKTTIARAIFDTLSYQFEAACFLADVKENAKRNQLHSLQNILLSELLRKKDDYVNNKYDGKCMIPSRLCSKKVLIVLDDIDHSDHLEYLAGDLGWFGNCSRVIVTARNRHLIEKDDAIYEVPTLPDQEAMQLFNQHAFKKEVPDECFNNFSLVVVNHAKGLPLALKLWGSLLHKKGLTQWRRTVDQIKKNSSSEIVEKRKISYDGLEPEEQKIFLDMTCFFRGIGKEEVMQILESYDFGAEYRLDVLIDKSLVFISEYDMIEMHDLIQDMGRCVVKMQKDLGEPSRLWDVEDFEEVMVNNTGAKAMEAIWLEEIQNLCFSKKAIKNMRRLRILYIGHFDTHDDSIEHLPNSLCWFDCHNYPWESLPETFEPKRLVHLDLQWSLLRRLWTGAKHLPYIRKLDLSYSKSLMGTPDFTGMPNLEYLNLGDCSNLEEVHHSIGCCRKLIELDLCWCKSLKRFPCVNVESLESLNLQYCSKLEKFPEILGRMKLELVICLSDSGIRELSSFINYQTHTTKLNLSCLRDLVVLPSSICMLKSLVELDVSYCLILESLPEEIGDLLNLEKLDARRTLISRPPSSIVHLNKLKFLSFEKRYLEVVHGVYFVFPQVNEGLHSLEDLDLGYCSLIDGGLPEDIGCLYSLKKLYLGGNNFEHLPRSIAKLGALQYLDLSDCKSLKQLPELPPELDAFHVDYHMALKSIHNLAAQKNLKKVILTPLYDSIYNSCNDSEIYNLFQNIASLQLDISVSDSFSLRVLTIMHPWEKIPSWFPHQGRDRSVSVTLPENWFVCDNFLGFAVCYSGSLIGTTAQLIPLCDDGMSWMTQELDLSDNSEYCYTGCGIHLFLVPLASLWDTTKANGKTPNDYGLIRLSFSGQMKEYGFRLLYKDEPELEALLQMRENNDEHCIGTRRSGYDGSEHRESVTNEASCSSSKKHYICGRVTSLFRNFAAFSCKPKNLA